jgi:crotonobetainyl-CoA:carnitine CoA-transferase CaiB-like acyl-CoA transferase
MKRPLPIILVLSLVAILVLAAGLALSPRARQSVQTALGSPTSAAAPTVAGRSASTAGGEGALEPAEKTVTLREVASRLLTGDLKELVANLRAAGFPPKVVRAIVEATLDEQFAARRRKIMGDQLEVPYWKPGSTAALFSSPQMSALRQLAREEQDTLKQLLGPDSATAEVNRFYQQRMYGDLPSEKLDAIQRIQQDYNELRGQIYGEAGNGSTMLPWDREKLALLEKEQHDDITGELTAEELRQYDLRSSSTAQRLRNQLTYFSPTEKEFLAVYDLQSQFDQTHNPMTMGFQTPDEMRQRQADQQQLQAQIKAVLGDPRYQDYQQSIDNGFMAASRIASTLQLPAQNAAAVWTLQQSIQQQATSLRTDRSQPPEQRMQALQTLTAQADQQLTTLLTQAGADAYKQTPGGMWLRSMESALRRPSSGTGTNSTGTTATVPPRP